MKYSKQRDLVLKTLQENVVHPTADFVYAKAKEHNPNISLATVYRNLNQLVESGDIKKINGLDNMAHFDHNTHKHFHFICTKCGKIFDMPYDIVPELNTKPAEQKGLIIESYDISFHGICPDCRDNH